MKFIFALLFMFASSQSFAANYKCYSSKYPTGMTHAFEDGYTNLSIKGKTATLKYYSTNEVAGTTSLQFNAKYKVGAKKGGDGKLKDTFVSALVSSSSSLYDIDTIYLEPSLVDNQQTDGSNLVGKFAFSGQGFGYDWNLCYNQ